MSVLITTPVANFNIAHFTKLFASGNFPLDSWVRGYSKSYPQHRVQLWDEKLHLIFDAGPKDITPAIWTHTPIPQGMDIESLKANFEARAASVLGDYDAPVNFEADQMYRDGRYLDINVRCAWMMYVDQAIEQYVEKH